MGRHIEIMKQSETLNYTSVFAIPEAAYTVLDPNGQETVALFKDELWSQFVIPFLQNRQVAVKVFMDGVAAAGKGTLLELLEKCGFEVTSTGTIARAITKYAIENGYTAWSSEEEKKEKITGLQADLAALKLELIEKQGKLWAVIKKKSTRKSQVIAKYDVVSDLGAPSITQHISFIAGLDFVCDMLDRTLIEIATQFQHVAVDGRDNVKRKLRTQEELAYQQKELPNTTIHDLYVYVYADLVTRQERAVQRRIAQLQAADRTLSEVALAAELAEVRQSVAARDMNDMNRRRGNLMPPEEARNSTLYDVFLDTTLLNIDEMQVVFLAHLFAHVAPEQGVVLLQMITQYFDDRERERQTALLQEAQDVAEIVLTPLHRITVYQQAEELGIQAPQLQLASFA